MDKRNCGICKRGYPNKRSLINKDDICFLCEPNYSGTSRIFGKVKKEKVEMVAAAPSVAALTEIEVLERYFKNLNKQGG
tara:strand:+ start:7757 stop:7993 length:237 start_codon:yes stop_codon:yes gene_type:complete